MAVSVRPATAADTPQIQSIFEHYVLNTVVSFLVQDPPSDYIQTRFEESQKRGLPYIVAVTSKSDDEKVVGYAYASGFRGFMLGYNRSVEMSVFCHPEYTKLGIGSEMMKELIAQLKQTKHKSREVGHDDNIVEADIKNVLAIMAVDETAPGNGLALRDWYLKWGFEEVGRLRGIGYKKDRVIDTIYLQLKL